MSKAKGLGERLASVLRNWAGYARGGEQLAALTAACEGLLAVGHARPVDRLLQSNPNDPTVLAPLREILYLWALCRHGFEGVEYEPPRFARPPDFVISHQGLTLHIDLKCVFDLHATGEHDVLLRMLRERLTKLHFAVQVDVTLDDRINANAQQPTVDQIINQIRRSGATGSGLAKVSGLPTARFTWEPAESGASFVGLVATGRVVDDLGLPSPFPPMLAAPENFDAARRLVKGALDRARDQLTVEVSETSGNILAICDLTNLGSISDQLSEVLYGELRLARVQYRDGHVAEGVETHAAGGLFAGGYYSGISGALLLDQPDPTDPKFAGTYYPNPAATFNPPALLRSLEGIRLSPVPFTACG